MTVFTGAWVSGSGTSLTLAADTTASQNDILLAFITADVATWSLPSGWAAVPSADINTDADGHRFSTFWKRAGASETNSYVFSGLSATYNEGRIHRVTGRITTEDPFDVTSSTHTTAGPTTITATSITTVTDGCTILQGTSSGNGGSGWAVDNGFTLLDGSASANSARGYKAQATAGAVGTTTWTAPIGVTALSAISVALKPVSSAPTISTPPVTTYASGDYTDSGHTWGLTFTATDADTTGADALTYYVRTSATFGAGTQVATGTCTSGASKAVTGLAYNASGLVAGPNTLYLHIYDGALNTVTASPLGVNVGAPVAVNVSLFSPLMVGAAWFGELAANATAWFDREYFDAPSGTALSPATASLTLSTFAPTVTVTTNYVATPAIATLTLTGYAPSAIIGTVITPATATLTLATFAPTVTLNTIVTPSTATLTLTGYAPALNLTLTPSTASLTLTTFAPSAVVNTTATPSTASLALTGFAPDVTVSGGAPVSVTPDTASLTLTGFAPTATVTANIIVTPGTAALTLATFAPSAAVTANVTVTPGTASLTLASFTPTATATANYTLTPTTASLTLSTFAPTAVIDTPLTPATATLVLAAFAPAITLNTIITPGTAALLLVAFAPLIPELAPVASPGDAIVSIPNWGVPYKLPAYMKAIHYAPQRWKPPRYKKPW